MSYNNYDNKPLPATLGSATYRLVAKALQGKLPTEVKNAVLAHYNSGAKNNFLKSNKATQNKVLASLKRYGQDVEDGKFFKKYWNRNSAQAANKPSARSVVNYSKMKTNEIFA